MTLREFRALEKQAEEDGEGDLATLIAFTVLACVLVLVLHISEKRKAHAVRDKAKIEQHEGC